MDMNHPTLFPSEALPNLEIHHHVIKPLVDPSICCCNSLSWREHWVLQHIVNLMHRYSCSGRVMSVRSSSIDFRMNKYLLPLDIPKIEHPLMQVHTTIPKVRELMIRPQRQSVTQHRATVSVHYP